MAQANGSNELIYSAVSSSSWAEGTGSRGTNRFHERTGHRPGSGITTNLSYLHRSGRPHGPPRGAPDHPRVSRDPPCHRAPGPRGYGNDRESAHGHDPGDHRDPDVHCRGHGHGGRGHGPNDRDPVHSGRRVWESYLHGCDEERESGHDEEGCGHDDGHGPNQIARRRRGEYEPTRYEE